MEAILTRDRVQGWLAVHYAARVREPPLRRYGSRPAPRRVVHDLRLKAVVNRHAVATAIGRLGWRVSATHTPPDQLPLSPAVLAYRRQYLVESAMGRLQGRPWSLTPLYLARDDHVTGLIRLLSVGWRLLTLVEFVVRRCLAAERTVRTGVSAGNPTRTTARPTTERLLERVQGLTLTIIREGRRRRSHLTPLSHVQRRILTRLHFPGAMYTRLCPDSHQPP